MFPNLILVRKCLHSLSKHAAQVADKVAAMLRAYNICHYHQEGDFIYVT